MKAQDALENYLIYGLHIPNRKIYFGVVSSADGEPGDQSDFGHCSVALAIRAIDLMVDMNSKPIEIHMCSYGGDPYFMMALKDKILESPVKFKFYGRGRISSAATWIMAVCDERYLSEDTTIMVHNGGTWRDGESGETKMTDQSIEAEEDERLQDRLNELYAQNSKFPKSFWDLIVQRDCYMTAEEAVMLGLADEIVAPKRRLSFRKKRQAHLASTPSKRQMDVLVKRLLKRVKMDKFAKDIKIHVPEDKSEELPDYDNTQQELDKLNTNNIDNHNESDKVE